MPPKTAAALHRAVARIPGVRVTSDAVAVVDQHGMEPGSGGSGD